MTRNNDHWYDRAKRNSPGPLRGGELPVRVKGGVERESVEPKSAQSKRAA